MSDDAVVADVAARYARLIGAVATRRAPAQRARDLLSSATKDTA